MAFSSADDDSQQRFALGFLFALIALVVSSVVGVTVYKQRSLARAPVVEPAAVVVAPAGTLVVAEDEVARVVVDGGVVRFYFATGRADLAPGAAPALADVSRAVAEGRSVVVSGFHDATGDAAANAQLAKDRAFAVRDALKTAGVPEDKIDLRKPAVTQAGGSNAEARRVEVTLAPL
ncbi:OmpA family protein [Acidovorax sp. SUPP2522]|uniref:OmpA family protein n=1 Tax=unclassified Acidovorax TaxID=2684926 RepID=UPI00234A8A9C|nr:MULTISPECIES: OmpA family protein [unclassified Acidovorax]WCM95515.1 OmpA family protein [Acidovorax sp. GBBC 1281]GKT18249.1 OmpA family protein [Acidovorax sp. SUPP2522]